MRHLLRRWLRGHGADEDETYDITVACQEACANAVEHAYAPGPAGFDLEAEHAEGEIRLTVRDRGQWRDARGTHRGRGLPIMEALMDTVDIQHSPRRHGRHACAARSERGPRMSTLLEIHEEWHDDVPVLRLEGEIDVSNVDEIRGRGCASWSRTARSR